MSHSSEVVQTMDNTTSHIDITTTTEGNVTRPGSAVGQTSLNLALIPLIAVVVLTVVGCLKCCQWFRRYTRGGRKDESYYAVIVEDGDEDHVDMPYNDTVSSYSSFIRRSNTEGLNTDVKSQRAEFSDSPRRWLLNKLGSSRQDSVNSVHDLNEKQVIPSRRRDRSLNTTSSVSSVDTEVVELSVTESTHKKSKRFKVSFVSDTGESPVRTYTPSDWVYDKKTKDLRVLAQQAMHLTAIPAKLITKPLPEMVTVATQTNKTCQNSIRTAKLLSESTASYREGTPPKFSLFLGSTESDNTQTKSTSCGTDTDKKLSNDLSPCTSDCTATEFVDDVFESDREADVTTVTIHNSCLCNKNANASDNLCKDNCGNNYDTSVCDTQTYNSCIDVHHIDNTYSQPTPQEISSHNENVNSQSSPLNGHVPPTSNVENTIQNVDVNNIVNATDIKEPLTSVVETSDSPERTAICYHCGSSLRRYRHPHKRYNSEQSDNKSSSITSLESSGYADELSFDGSEGP